MTSDLANFFKKSRKRYTKYCCTVHSRTRVFQVGWNRETYHLEKLWVNPALIISSNINEVIRSVLDFLFFFTIRFHKYKKAQK